MARSLRSKTLESILSVLGVEIMAHLALVRVRVLLILAAEDTLDALANEIHDGQICKFAAVSKQDRNNTSNQEEDNREIQIRQIKYKK